MAEVKDVLMLELVGVVENTTAKNKSHTGTKRTPDKPSREGKIPPRTSCPRFWKTPMRMRDTRMFMEKSTGGAKKTTPEKGSGHGISQKIMARCISPCQPREEPPRRVEHPSVN